MFDAMYKTASFENFKVKKSLTKPFVKTMSSTTTRENLLQAFFPIPILGLMSKIKRIDLSFSDLMAALALLL